MSVLFYKFNNNSQNYIFTWLLNLNSKYNISYIIKIDNINEYPYKSVKNKKNSEKTMFTVKIQAKTILIINPNQIFIIKKHTNYYIF